MAILFTTVLAFGLVWFADLKALGGTTSFLLLIVFTITNIAVLVLRRDKVEHRHFKAPTVIPVIGAVLCGFLASPLSKRDPKDYQVAAVLLVVGVVLWLLHWLSTRFIGSGRTNKPEHIEELGIHHDELNRQREGRPWT